LNAGVLGVEMKDEVKPPVLISILDMASPMSFYRPIGAKFNGQGVDGGGVKGIGSENGDRDDAASLRVDGVVGVAGFDV
jgi:hypothetical protein